MYNCKIVADSRAENGVRLTTFEVTYPLIVLAEMNTHRVFSRNVASCLSGDTRITVDKPMFARVNMRSAGWRPTIKELYDKWHTGDSLGRSMVDRLSEIRLRCLNEDTGEFITTTIEDIFNQGTQSLFEVTLSNGKTLKCTDNHKIFTEKGWTTLKKQGISIGKSGIVTWDKNFPKVASNGVELTVDFLIKQREEGKSLKQVAIDLNINYKSLCSFCDKNSYKHRKVNLEGELDLYKDASWLHEKRKEGYSTHAIAELSKTTVDKVKRQVSKFKIPLYPILFLTADGKKRKSWNLGKTYSLPDSSLVNVRLSAKARTKKKSYLSYKSRNVAITRFLQEIRMDKLAEWGYKCALSGSIRELQLHHVIPTWYDDSRCLDESNIVPLNKDVHRFIHSNNLDLLLMEWHEEGKPLLDFIEEHKELKLKCIDINKPRGKGNSLVCRYSEVVGIKYVGEEETYDIEVSGKYKNFIANGIVVHNSRAIPVAKLIKSVQNSPFIPEQFPKNKAGMQNDEWLTGRRAKMARVAWLGARTLSVWSAKALMKLGVHKQITNRLLAPFLWTTAVITATDWENFFSLRCHPAAQPEIRKIAEMMKIEYEGNRTNIRQLKQGEWHLPYVTDENFSESFILAQRGGLNKTSIVLKEKAMEMLQLVSIGRCARVSYLTHGTGNTLEKDKALAERLMEARHMSPTEHVATPSASGEYFGNFRGWKQYRKFIEGESGQEIEKGA